MIRDIDGRPLEPVFTRRRVAGTWFISRWADEREFDVMLQLIKVTAEYLPKALSGWTITCNSKFGATYTVEWEDGCPVTLGTAEVLAGWISDALTALEGGHNEILVDHPDGEVRVDARWLDDGERAG